MNGAKAVAEASKAIKRGEFFPIYFDFKTQTVMTGEQYETLADKDAAFKVVDLIRPKTESEIIRVVEYWKSI